MTGPTLLAVLLLLLITRIVLTVTSALTRLICILVWLTLLGLLILRLS